METFVEIELGYEILPGDSIFNMDLKHAAECAKLIGAKHNIIIHLTPDRYSTARKSTSGTLRIS